MPGQSGIDGFEYFPGLPLAVTCTQEAGSGHPLQNGRCGLGQNPEPLALLLHPSQESDGGFPLAPLPFRARPGIAQGSGFDAVGDDLAGYARLQQVPGVLHGRWADEDGLADVGQVSAQVAPGQPQGQRGRIEGRMEGGHIGAGNESGPQGLVAQGGHLGLVQVQDVEVALSDPLPGLVAGHAEVAQVGHGSVVGNGEGGAGGMHPEGHVLGAPARGQNLHLVAALHKMPGEVADVQLDAARGLEGVGRDDPHPQRRLDGGPLRLPLRPLFGCLHARHLPCSRMPGPG